MITDEQVRRIALFYLCTLMDERVALQAAHKTVAYLKAKGASAQNDGPEVIRALRSFLEQHRKQIQRHKQAPASEPSWIASGDVNMRPWVRFQKEAPETEVEAVVLSKVLGFSVSDIARGLNVSIGTIRYRIGKGVTHLGAAQRKTLTDNVRP